MMSSDIKHIKMAFKNKSAKIGVIGVRKRGVANIVNNRILSSSIWASQK